MKKFPDVIPIFPLSGVIYFPKTNLPLNIFEQRYLDLVNDAYKKDKFMGMVQSRKGTNDVYDIGCLGKISDYQKSKDGRILINLTGISRFKIQKEIESKKLYRQFQVDYESFISDIDDNFKTIDTKGLEFNPILNKWKKSNNLSVNYIFCSTKN